MNIKNNIERNKYLLVYFKGEYEENGEQVYFAISEDGLNWGNINGDKPVIISTLGECGVSDPFIIRANDNNKFYIIATDLRIYGNGDWEKAQNNGSQSIMIWESTDLINWSNQRKVKLSLDTAGCTWAPEVFFDESSNEYIIFWASRIPIAKGGKDNYQRVYYSRTKDFYNFSDPDVWIELKDKDENVLSVIDSTVTKVDNIYYRFTKNESEKYIYLEKSYNLLGSWSKVNSPQLESIKNVEGPICYKIGSENKWCLLIDNYGQGGYYPLISSDLSIGEFEKIDKSKYKLPTGARHGSVISISDSEFKNLKRKYY